MITNHFTLTHVKVKVDEIGGWQFEALHKAKAGQNFYLEGADYQVHSTFCDALNSSYGYTVAWETHDHQETKAIFTKIMLNGFGRPDEVAQRFSP